MKKKLININCYIFLISIILSQNIKADNFFDQGKKIFIGDGNCATCHTLQDANSYGNIGPNLDEIKPDITRVIYAVTNNTNSTEASLINNFAHVNYNSKSPLIGKLLCINGAGIMYRWLRNQSGDDSYETMNRKAEIVDIGSDGLSIIPFGNGAERMLDNKNIGSQFCNINLNIHTKEHLYRAALEGIAFSFVYGMEILKNDNTVINVLRAGNDNLFRSEIFSNTLATLIGHKIEIYSTTGAVGAARAAGLLDGDFDKFGKNITNNDHVMTYKPQKNKEAYLTTYKRWKTELENILKIKL